LSHPANRPILLWHVRALVNVVRLLKDPLRLLKADPAFGIRPWAVALLCGATEPAMNSRLEIIFPPSIRRRWTPTLL